MIVKAQVLIKVLDLALEPLRWRDRHILLLSRRHRCQNISLAPHEGFIFRERWYAHRALPNQSKNAAAQRLRELGSTFWLWQSESLRIKLKSGFYLNYWEMQLWNHWNEWAVSNVLIRFRNRKKSAERHFNSEWYSLLPKACLCQLQ
jgi:hypothetical protein